MEYENAHQLREFVEKHDLIDRFSVIQFMALVSINTARNEIINREMRVMISFDDYGSPGNLTLLESDLNPYLFPTKFDSRWQVMEHENGERLIVSGTHSENHDIGKYLVKITPLERLRP